MSPLGEMLAEGPCDCEAVVMVELPDIRDCRDARALRMGDLRHWQRRAAHRAR